VQRRLIELFHFALRENGCLFLGKSESLSGTAKLFEPISKEWRIFRRLPKDHLRRSSLRGGCSHSCRPGQC
jgi:two-component system CheB/CheR fusion protein